MPNNNTVAQAILANGKPAAFPSDSLGASSTTEAQFSQSSSRYILYLPGSLKASRRPIKIRAWGRVTGGTTTNFTAQIYMGSSATIGSNTSIATSGARAVNAVSGNWLLECRGIWDDTSDKFQGVFRGHVNGVAVTDTILSSVTTPAVDPSTEGQGLTVTGTFSANNAGNTALLDGFEVNYE